MSKRSLVTFIRMRETVTKNGNRLSKNGKNELICIKITKALSLVINQKMELCLYIIYFWIFFQQKNDDILADPCRGSTAGEGEGAMVHLPSWLSKKFFLEGLSGYWLNISVFFPTPFLKTLPKI